MMDLYLIVKNMTRNKIRLCLNIFAILIAFLLFGVLGSFEKAFNAGVEMAADDRLVVVNKINFTQPMPYAYVQKIRSIPGIKLATHANWVGTYVKDSTHFFAGFAVDAESYITVYEDMFNVTPDILDRWIKNRQGVIIGEKLAQIYNWKVGDRVPLLSNIFTNKTTNNNVWDVDIIGIFNLKEDYGDTNMLLMHYAYFNETHSFGGDTIGWVPLVTENPELNQTVADTIDDMFANSSHETETSTEQQFSKAFAEQVGNISQIILLVVGAAFFTILLIVGNSMAMSVRERTRELAVLKTLGFSAPHMFRLVLSESMVIVLIGGALGLLMANITVSILAKIPNVRSMLPNLVIDSSIWVQALIYIVILGFITGFFPAYRAMQLNIVNALSRR